MSKHTKKWISGLLIGSIAGASIALLTASRSGKQTRKMIAEKSMDLRDKAVSTVDGTKNKIGKMTKNVIDETGDRVDRLKNIGRTVYKEEAAVMQGGIKESTKVLKS